MKRVFGIIAFVALVMMMSGCGSVLHNTPASFIDSVEVVNFPVPNGDYSFSGDDNIGWNYDKNIFTVTDGAGKLDLTATSPIMITKSELYFSILIKGKWDRAFTKIANRDSDKGPGTTWFYAFPMDGNHHTVKIDGSTSPTKFYLDGEVKTLP